MTGKKRALCAIQNLPHDRPSVLPSIDVCYAAKLIGRGVGECFADPVLHARALEHAVSVHPEIDGLYVNLCLTPRTVTKTAEERYLDTGGMLWRVPLNDVGTVCEHDITTLDDPRITTENPLMDGILDTFCAISDEVKQQYLVVPGITGPYSHLVFMLGLENVLMLAYDEPEKLKAALEQRTLHALRWAEKLAEAGAEAVWIGEGAASSSIISPAMYEEFVLPYAARVAQRLRELGVLSIMHVCGNINQSAAAVVSAGTDAIDIDYMVPMEHVAQVAGRNICLKGNLNPVSLQNSSPAQVEKLCAELLKNSPKPMILGTGCLVTRDTPPENLEAMVAASKKQVNR